MPLHTSPANRVKVLEMLRQQELERLRFQVVIHDSQSTVLLKGPTESAVEEQVERANLSCVVAGPVRAGRSLEDVALYWSHLSEIKEVHPTPGAKPGYLVCHVDRARKNRFVATYFPSKAPFAKCMATKLRTLSTGGVGLGSYGSVIVGLSVGAQGAQAAYRNKVLHALDEFFVEELGNPLAVEEEEPSGLPDALGKEHHDRLRQARQKIVDTYGLTSVQVARLGLHKSKNARQPVYRMKERGDVFYVIAGGEQIFPSFQFDPKSGQPRETIKKLLEAFPVKDDHWELTLWMTSPSSALDGMRPLDLLDSEPERVIEAAAAYGSLVHL